MDILDIHLKQLQKYYNYNIIVAIDNAELIEPYKNTNKIINIIEYDDALPYLSRISYILQQINYSYILFAHDMNILIDSPNMDVVYGLVKTMKEHDIDQIRLFVSGIDNPIFNDDTICKINNGPYYMSINTAIWKRETLLDISTRFSSHAYRCSECGSIQEYVKQFKNYYISSSNDILIKVGAHAVSYYFPFIHATFSGKWSLHTSINKYFITKFIKDYNIDLSKRGIIEQ